MRTDLAPPLIVDAFASISSPPAILRSLLALSVNVFASVLPSLSTALILTFISKVSVGSVTEVDFVVIVLPSAAIVTLFAFAAVGIVSLSTVTSFLTATLYSTFLSVIALRTSSHVSQTTDFFSAPSIYETSKLSEVTFSGASVNVTLSRPSVARPVS